MNLSIKSQVQQNTNAYDYIDELQPLRKSTHSSLPPAPVPNTLIKSGRKDNMEIRLLKNLEINNKIKKTQTTEEPVL